MMDTIQIRRPIQVSAMLIKYFLRYPYAPFLAHVVVTRRCNLSCGYCNEFDHISPSVETDRLLLTILKLKSLNINAISLTGGEPTLHEDLVDIIKFASSRIKKVSMISNGFKIDQNMIEKLNRAGLSRLQISLDGVEPNKMTKKVLKYLKPQLRLLEKYAKFRVHINTVLGSIPFDETVQTVDFVKNLGFETTVQWLHDKKGQVINPYGIGQAEIRRLSATCKFPRYHSRAVIQLGLKQKRPWKCRAGARYLYIDEFSKAYFCSQAKGLWSIPVDRLDEKMLRNNFFLSKRCAQQCTIGCVRDASRYDRFRRQ